MIHFIGNDTLVRLEGGYTVNLMTGELFYLNNAALVQFRVQTASAVDVGGVTWPVTMTWVNGSPGHFLGVMPRTMVVSPDTEYRFIGLVDNGVGQTAVWDLPLHARMRTLETLG